MHIFLLYSFFSLKKYLKFTTSHPPPPKKKNFYRAGTARQGGVIPGSATGIDISTTCYSNSVRSLVIFLIIGLNSTNMANMAIRIGREKKCLKKAICHVKTPPFLLVLGLVCIVIKQDILYSAVYLFRNLYSFRI